MGKVTGFLEYERDVPTRRPVEERVNDYFEIYQDFEDAKVETQAARCMDCGVPFCNTGCPLNNLIPDWNDLVYRDRWREAVRTLHATNNFPEFTGRICPAPCEAACVLGINAPSGNHSSVIEESHHHLITLVQRRLDSIQSLRSSAPASASPSWVPVPPDWPPRSSSRDRDTS